jgi:transcriptional antiterminator NusG
MKSKTKQSDNGNPGFNYYALQVKTREELKFMREAQSMNPDLLMSLYFPQRDLNIRKHGVVKPSRLAVFPGYVFLELGCEEDVSQYKWALKGIDGFYRFLKSNYQITPLQNKDLELVLHFIKKVGPVAGVSKVYFDENSRIVVLAGPVSGLDGKIGKVDKRKRRAKIVLDLYGDTFSLDLAFEVIEKVKEHKGAVL